MDWGQVFQWSANRILAVVAAIIIVRAVLLFKRRDWWHECVEAGRKACDAGDYAAAEKKYLLALKMAQHLGRSDTRMSMTVSCLAYLYAAQGKYDQAEPLYKRELVSVRKRPISRCRLECP